MQKPLPRRLPNFLSGLSEADDEDPFADIAQDKDKLEENETVLQESSKCILTTMTSYFVHMLNSHSGTIAVAFIGGWHLFRSALPIVWHLFQGSVY